MATRLQDFLAFIKSKETSISVGDLLEKVGSKLTAAEKEELLLSVLTRPGDRVRPGDLITADLLNQILSQLADLQVRVAVLEGGSTPDGKPKITFPKPGDLYRIGDELRIVGVNFGSADQATVIIDSTVTVNQFKGGSGERLLVFDIPFVQNVPTDGREVALAVKNSAGQIGASSFRLAQPRTLPSGSLTVTYSGKPPASTLAPGKHTFVYTIRAGITDGDVFDLQPTVSGGWSARIVDGNDNPKTPDVPIAKPSAPTLPTKATVRVQVDVPSGPGSAKLKLRATSRQNPSELFKESDEETLTINAAPPTPNAVGVSLVSVSSPGSKQGDVIVVPKVPGGSTEITVFTTFKAEVPAQGLYSVKLTFPADTSGKWSASVVPSGSGISMSPPETSFNIAIKAKADAPTTVMRVEVTSDADSAVTGDLYQNVIQSQS